MAIILNHTIVPAHGKVASAKWFARMFGLPFDERAVEYFAPVRVNDTLTLDFHDDVDRFEIHHYAFHVSDPEFDAILKRVEEAGITFGSDPFPIHNIFNNTERRRHNEASHPSSVHESSVPRINPAPECRSMSHIRHADGSGG